MILAESASGPGERIQAFIINLTGKISKQSQASASS